MKFKKRVVSLILVLMALCTLVPASTFALSTPSSWAVDEINEAKNANLVTNSVTNDYQANITREQFCEMVVLAYEKISGETASSGIVTFNDTSNSEILKAANLGIVNGVGGGSFAPNDYITRQEIAAMLVRMIDAASSSANVSVYNSHSFADLSSIDNWALPSINYAYDNGIMQGVGGNMIAPLDNTTCEEAILLVYRTVEKYYDEESQLDSIYELTEEHIAQDDETYVHYTDNIVLAFIKRGLSETEKQNIADLINGEIAGQLAGAINLLQIEVEVSNLDELTDIADTLMENNNVYYATADYLTNTQNISSNSDLSGGAGRGTYAGEDAWWVDAIDAKYVWNNYDKYIEPTTVGVIDPGAVRSDHKDISDKLTFVIDGQKEYNDTMVCDNSESASHATAVSSLICANRNNIAMTGVANKSNIVFATMAQNNNIDNEFDENDYVNNFDKDYYFSIVWIAYLLKKEVEDNAKVINCSFGYDCYTEDYFNTYREEFDDYVNYASYVSDIKTTMPMSSRIITACMCQIIVDYDSQFLVVQAAGNGENNGGLGLEIPKNGSFWTGITSDFCEDILNYYGLAYSDLRNRYILVGSVDNKKDNNSDYLMATSSNYGSNIDICAPGGSPENGIYTCTSTGDTDVTLSWGTSLAAPMVSGAAAVLWGIDPTLTAVEIKNLLKDETTKKAVGVKNSKGNTYPMLNLKDSVESLLEKRRVYIKVLDEDDHSEISDVNISFGDNITTTTDANGIVNFCLPYDTNEITLAKDGYKTTTIAIENEYLEDSVLVNVKKIYLEKEESADHSSYVGKWDWESSEPLLANQDNWYTYNEAWVDIKEVTGNQITFEYYHQKGGSHLYFYDTCEGYIENGVVVATTNARKIQGDPVMAQFQITLNLYDDRIYLESYNIDEQGVAFEGNFYKSDSEYYDYSKILDGDFSDFAGTWADEYGSTFTLQSNGTPESGTNPIYNAEMFQQEEDGSYWWYLSVHIDGKAYEGYWMILYPIGVNVVAYDGSIVSTDTSQVRIWCGNGDVTNDPAYIYYKE